VPAGTGTPGSTALANRLRESAVQNEMETKEAALVSAMECFQRQAMRRADAFFAAPSPQAFQAKYEAAARRVDEYLAYRAEQGASAPPESVRQMMIRFDMGLDLRSAVGARGNVIVRKDDPMWSQGADDLYSTADLDTETMERKLIPAYLSDRVVEEFGKRYSPTSARFETFKAAASLLMGAATCDGYASLAAFRTAAIAHELGQSFEEVRLSKITGPEIEVLKENPSGTPRVETTTLDHGSLLVKLVTEDKEAFSILLEPWSETNTPVLDEQMEYLAGSGEPILAHDCKSSPLIPGFAEEDIRQDMNLAYQLLQKVVRDPRTLKELLLIRESMEKIDPHSIYSLATPALNYFVDRIGTNDTMVFPDGFPTRRPSVSRREENPLAQWFKTLLNQAQGPQADASRTE